MQQVEYIVESMGAVDSIANLLVVFPDSFSVVYESLNPFRAVVSKWAGDVEHAFQIITPHYPLSPTLTNLLLVYNTERLCRS